MSTPKIAVVASNALKLLREQIVPENKDMIILYSGYKSMREAGGFAIDSYDRFLENAKRMTDDCLESYMQDAKDGVRASRWQTWESGYIQVQVHVSGGVKEAACRLRAAAEVTLLTHSESKWEQPKRGEKRA
jgi:hypothetical protein